MKKQWKKALSLLLSVCMAVTLLPTMAFAEAGSTASSSGKITGFAPLDAAVCEQTAPQGTAKGDLSLPETLEVTVATAMQDSGADAMATAWVTVSLPVTWDCADYDEKADVGKIFPFSPKWDETEYPLGEDVSAPQITVTLTEANEAPADAVISKLDTMAAPMATAFAAEQDTGLTAGDTYYFDLSSAGISGLGLLNNIPDKDLQWVPFTYTGTVNAYSRSTAGASGAPENQSAYLHPLFISNYILIHGVSWETLNNNQLIFGKTIEQRGAQYSLRALSVGSNINSQPGDAFRCTPETNEWDQILNKDAAYIPNNPATIFCWGQDSNAGDLEQRYLRGTNIPTGSGTRGVFTYSNVWKTSTDGQYSFGYRPVLQPTSVDTLKTVTYNMEGYGTMVKASLKKATVVYSGKLTLPEITIANGFYLQDSSNSLWTDGTNTYKPGEPVELPSGVELHPAYRGHAPEEQYPNLSPGGTYYFDLPISGIPGVVNSNLPDTSLKWVPFTYAGTVNAYSDHSKPKDYSSVNIRDYSLFIADHNITNQVSISSLADLALGGMLYDSAGVNYAIRSPSAGADKDASGKRGVPGKNEWDQILDKNPGYIKMAPDEISWGKDYYQFDDTNPNPKISARGGFQDVRLWDQYSAFAIYNNLGFRPVLEIKSPVGTDLKSVSFDMGGMGTIGKEGKLTSVQVVYTGELTLPEITQANGFQYQGTGTLGWYYGTTFYAQGTKVTLPTGATLLAGSKEVPLNYSAEVDTGAVTFSAMPLGYGNQAEKCVTVTNTGTGALTNMAATLSADSPFEFTKPMSGISVAPNAAVQIGVRPKKGLAIGAYEDTLSIRGNNNITFSVNLDFTVYSVSMAVKTPPAKTAYFSGESLDLTGLVVTLSKNGGSTEDVPFADFSTKGITVSPANGATLATSNTKVIITHTASGKTAEQAITVTDRDAAMADAAKTAIEQASFKDMTQAAATSEIMIKGTLRTAAEVAVNNEDVTVSITKVSYTAPTAGTVGNPSGTDGSFTFTVKVQKGVQERTTAEKTIAIIATPYTGLSNAQAVDAAKAALKDGSVDVVHGATQDQKTAAIQVYVNDLLKTVPDAAGVTATVTYDSGNQYTVALSKGSANGSKTITMTVNEAPAPVTVTSVTVKTPPAKTDYAAGDTLDLSGLVAILHKSDGTTEDAVFAEFGTKGLTVNPSNGATLATSNTKVIITHTTSGRTAEQAITVTDPDAAIADAAKTAVEQAPFDNMTQAAAANEIMMKGTLRMAAEVAVNNEDVTVSIIKISYTAPTAGTAGNPDGTDGSFTFTVKVKKGVQERTTAAKTIAITATPYTGLSDTQAVDAAKAALKDGSVDVVHGATQDQKTAAVQTYVNTLLIGDATGVTATVTYDSENQYTVALSKGSANGSKTITMTVNEAPAPTPTITIIPLPNGTMSVAYIQTLAASGDTPITWSLESGSLPTGIVLNASTGVLSGTPTAAGTFTFTVKAENAAGSDTGELSITVVPNQDLEAVNDAGAKAKNATYQDMAQADATSEAVIADALKATAAAAVNNSSVTVTIIKTSYTAPTAGTADNPSGTNGSYAFQVKVAKGVWDGIFDRSIAIIATAYTAPSVAPSITTSTLPNGTMHVPYSQTLAASGSVPLAWSIESGSLPAGIALNASTGVLSGTPAGTGTFMFTVKAENAAGSDRKELSTTINAAAAATNPITVQNDGNGTGSANSAAAASGAVITLSSNSNDGYHFKEWQVISPMNLTITGNTFTMPNEAVTVKAIFERNSGGSNTDNGGSSSGVKPSGTNSNPGATIIVNGQSQTAGTSQTTTNTSGQIVTTVTVDTGRLEDILVSQGRGATVTIPVTNGSDVAAGTLTGEMIKRMADKEATLVIQTNFGSYTIPASEINIGAVSQQLGVSVSLADINVTVSIAEPSVAMTRVVENAVRDGGFTLLVPAVDYTITCTYGGQSVNVSSFNAYVERTIAIPDGVDPAKITTGVVVDHDGTVHHVPTRVTLIGGKYYAVINSLTNSTYSIIRNSVEFSDVIKHWAKDSINDMGSRMIVTGAGNNNYAPGRSMTRAEFAAIIVRALGLEPETGDVSFHDVASSDWFCGYIKTAVKYGIVEGNGKFGPKDTITREQAMTMLVRAMKLTGLNADLNDDERGKLLSAFSDGSTVSTYARDGVAACLKTGVSSGTSTTALSPKAAITRAEVAVMVERLLQKSGLI